MGKNNRKMGMKNRKIGKKNRKMGKMHVTLYMLGVVADPVALAKYRL